MQSNKNEKGAHSAHSAISRRTWLISLSVTIGLIGRTVEEIKTINEELVAINRIITAITGVSQLHEILEKALDEALGIAGLEGGTICLVTPQNTLQLAAHRATSAANAWGYCACSPGRRN